MYRSNIHYIQNRLVQSTGEVLYNNKKLTMQQKRHIGYVLQDDLLYESLTVWETLYYAAMLRLPNTMSKAEKVERVRAVIQTLGLQKCQHTIVGGHRRRGLSGGERKRVSVGSEMLINPAVLLLDEPTRYVGWRSRALCSLHSHSGLDSTIAMQLLVTLRQLASDGRAIITTIHQPSSRLYQQLDSLLLLSQGHIIYYGKACDVVTWFEALGCTKQPGSSTSDFILDLASGEIISATLYVSVPLCHMFQHSMRRGSKDGEGTRLQLVAHAEKYLSEYPEGYSSDASRMTVIVRAIRHYVECLMIRADLTGNGSIELPFGGQPHEDYGNQHLERNDLHTQRPVGGIVWASVLGACSKLLFVVVSLLLPPVCRRC